MRKFTLSVAALILFGTSLFAKPNRKHLSFQNFIAKQVYSSSSFLNEHVEGTVKILVKFSDNKISKVTVLSGINSKVDQQIVDLVKNTPEEYVADMIKEDSKGIIIPVKLIILE